MSIQVTFEIGHEAAIRTKKTPEGFTHDWEVFVRGGNGTQLHYFVERVVFFLHETFPNPKRVIKQPPYVVKESGYAGFILPIEIHLRHSSEPKKIKFNYDLSLQPSGPAISKVNKEKYVFKNPTDEFRSCLLKGGGTVVSLNSIHDSGDSRLSLESKNELVNKPKLSGSDNMKKHRNRLDEQRITNSFQDLFGTPITKTNKVFSDPKSAPKDSTKSSTTSSGKTDKEKEKSSKEKTSKFSPSKERERDKTKEKSSAAESTAPERKKDRGDDKKSKDKDRKDRDRDHSKEKSSKREKSPKARSLSPKRAISPKRSVTPPKYKEEKSTSKDRERKDKDEAKAEDKKKSKKDKRDKEHKERKSREKELTKEHKEHRSKDKKDVSKEQQQPQQVEVKVENQKKPEKPAKDFLNQEKEDKMEGQDSRLEKKTEEQRKEKHKHKKKDKDKKDRDKKEKDKDRSKEKDKVKIEIKEPKLEEKDNLFSSPKIEDRKKMSLFSSEQDLSNSSLSSADEDGTHFEPATKKIKAEEKPKKEKSKKSKDRKADKEEKRRKRKAERAVSEERPSKVPPKEELPPIPTTTAKIPPQELHTSDSEAAAVETTTQASNNVRMDVERENLPADSQEEYMEVLRGLQFKIMNLQDNSELQKVVQMIAQTGQYEVSQRTFDFDLCLLDKGTVRQLQDFFESIS